jgi:uncharacterized protein YjiS (DUF1127 family)
MIPIINAIRFPDLLAAPILAWYDMRQEGSMFAYKVIASLGQPMAARHARRQSPLRLRSLGDWIGRALHNHTTRRYLAEMDERTLADLGISRAQATFEASRWMWN